jgi:hypothetical protein
MYTLTDVANPRAQAIWDTNPNSLRFHYILDSRPRVNAIANR